MKKSKSERFSKISIDVAYQASIPYPIIKYEEISQLCSFILLLAPGFHQNVEFSLVTV